MRTLLSKRQWRAIRSFASVLIVGFCGIAMSVGTWYMLSQAETRTAIREFDSRSANQAAVLEDEINGYWDELYAVQDLFKSSDRNVTRGEFDRFVRLLISRHSAILNIAWAPRVKRGERAAHEQLVLGKGCLTITSAPLDPTAACRFLPNGMNTFQNSIRPKQWALPFMGSISTMGQTRLGRSRTFAMRTHYRSPHRCGYIPAKAIGSAFGPDCRYMRPACRTIRSRNGDKT